MGEICEELGRSPGEGDCTWVLIRVVLQSELLVGRLYLGLGGLLAELKQLKALPPGHYHGPRAALV